MLKKITLKTIYGATNLNLYSQTGLFGKSTFTVLCQPSSKNGFNSNKNGKKLAMCPGKRAFWLYLSSLSYKDVLKNVYLGTPGLDHISQ